MPERIKGDMTAAEVIMQISEGNAGAVNVCVQLVRGPSQLDRSNELEGYLFLLDLDSLGIYGSHIWDLYKNVCREDISLFIAVLTSCLQQLDGFTVKALRSAIDDVAAGRKATIDLDAAVSAVKKCYPSFLAS